jgi:glutathione S-transferase
MLPRFRLWHSADTRSLRVLWTLEELGLKRGKDYAMRTLPFPPRQHTPDFLSTNVLGTVPYFEHQEVGDATPRASMTESCAVPQYLVEQVGDDANLTIPPGHHDRGAYLNWLCHADATLTFPQAVVMRYGIFEQGVADAAADGYSKWFVARLRLLNLALDDGRAFLCGDRMTIADICVTYALYNACEHGIFGLGLASVGKEPLSAFYKPQTRAYLERMLERPAWRAAQAEQAAPDDF